MIDKELLFQKFVAQYRHYINLSFAYVDNKVNKEDIEQDKILCFYQNPEIARLYAKGHDRQAYNLFQNAVYHEIKKYNQFNLNVRCNDSYSRVMDMTHSCNPYIDEEGNETPFMDTINTNNSFEDDLLDAIEPDTLLRDTFKDIPEKHLFFMIDYHNLTMDQLMDKYKIAKTTVYSKYCRLLKQYRKE